MEDPGTGKERFMMDRNTLFGGSPINVIIRLAILSLVVGIILSALGITPENLFYRLNILAGRLYEMGFKSVEWVFGYLLLGAIVVVPIWLITRTLGLMRKNDEDSEN